MLEERLAGLALHLIIAGIPLEPLDRYICLVSSQPRVPHESAAYGRRLLAAIADLESGAVEHGYEPEAVRSWRSIPVPTAIAVCEWLLTLRD